MLRSYLTISILAILCIVISSCEVPVEIEGNAQIVIQSSFTDFNDLVVYVAESTDLNDQPSSNFSLENATVTLYSGGDYEFIGTLEFVKLLNESYYTTVDFVPQMGKEYHLNVEVPGYKPVTATNSIPLRVETQAQAGNSNTVLNEGVSTFNFDVIVTINDPVETTNFYHVLFNQELLCSSVNESGETVYDTIMLPTENLFLETQMKPVDMEQIQGEPSFILTDNGFNGQQIHIDFSGHFEYDQDKYELGGFLIEMRSVSEAYYDHIRSFAASNKPNSGAEPYEPFDYFYDGNIINGSGFFIGYSSSYRRIRFN